MANPIVTITMDNGDVMKAELYPEVAPNTVNNFISLVKKGFYDGLIFHRVIIGFMIQGGCPDGTGMGGPGYSIKGEFSQNRFKNALKHTPGDLSMARAMNPNSAGSQFFIMHKAAPHLDGSYAAFGQIIEGMDVVNAIAETVSDYSDRPLVEQKISSMTVDTFGVDYQANDVTTPFFTMLMRTLPKKFNGITASFGKGVSYATLYNPNYVGSYVALVLPLTIYEAPQDEKNRYKIVAATSAVSQLIMLKGSGSLAGMVGVGAAVCVAVLFLFSDIHKNRKILCGVFVVAVGLVVLFLRKNPTFFRSVIKGNGEPCSSHISSMISDGTSVKIT